MNKLLKFIAAIFGKKEKPIQPVYKPSKPSTFEYPGYYDKRSGLSYDDVHDFDR